MNWIVKTTTVLILLCVITGYSQDGIIAINAGYFNPKDAKSGLLVGGILGKSIDEAVDIGIGFDVFHKSYSDITSVATSDDTGLTTEIEEREVDYSRTIIPLHLLINVKIPAGRYFGYLIRGGIGYHFLISKEKNYEFDTNQTRNFGGLGWQGGGGIFYHIGTRSTFTANIFYSSSEVSRDIEKSTRGLPITERVNLSGLGLKLGVIIYLE